MLIVALLIADLVIFPIADGRVLSRWDDWVRVGVTLVCMWRPVLGVPFATVLSAITPFLGVSDYDGWLFIVPPCAAAFGGRRWLPAVSMIGPIVAYVVLLTRGDWFSVPLWSPLALLVGIVANTALRRAVRDEAVLTDVILERKRLRLQERGRLADELDSLMLAHLDAVGSELDRQAADDDISVLSGAVARVDAAAKETLELLRRAVGYLRDDPGEQSTLVNPGMGLPERLEQVEDGLIGHGHPVELDLAVLPSLNPVLVESVGRVVDAAAACALRWARAGSTCLLSAVASGDEVAVSFSWVIAEEGPSSADPALNAAAARVRLVGGSVSTVSAAGRTTTVVSVPLAVRAAALEPSIAHGVSAPSWLDMWRGRWLPLTLSALWLFPLARTVWDLVAAGRPFTVQDCLDVAGYALAVVLVAAPAAQRVMMPLLGLLFVVYAVNGWSVVAVMWLWLTAGGVAAARRRWFPQWAAMGFTLLLWDAVTTQKTWVLVGYVQLSFLFIAGGLTIRYFFEHHERLRRELERERQALADVRLKERRLLAGELHDVVAHQLSLMTLQAGVLADSTDPDRLRAGLHSLADLNRAARADLALLRRVMVEGADGDPSRSARVGQAGIAAESALASGGFDAVVEVRETVEGAARSVRLTLVRLLRECSTNMLRYAPSGSRCTLRAWVHDSSVHFEALNPVSSASSHESPLATGVGLAGLAERINALGGTFSAGEQAGQWVVSAILPLEPPA